MFFFNCLIAETAAVSGLNKTQFPFFPVVHALRRDTAPCSFLSAIHFNQPVNSTPEPGEVSF